MWVWVCAAVIERLIHTDEPKVLVFGPKKDLQRVRSFVLPLVPPVVEACAHNVRFLVVTTALGRIVGCRVGVLDCPLIFAHKMYMRFCTKCVIVRVCTCTCLYAYMLWYCV